MSDALLRKVDEGRANTNGLGHLSWATSNEEMLARILDLYARPGMTIADVTYGKGRFWKLIETEDYDFRPTDLMDGVDARALPYPDESIDVLVLDPPYRYAERRMTANGLKLLEGDEYRIAALQELPAGIDGVLYLYREAIGEAARVLRRGGFAIVKCQDTAGDGKQTWVHQYVRDFCEVDGLIPVDMAVVVTTQPPPTRWKIQRSLKKAHSYFIVARKGGFYPFGYKSVQTR